MDEIHCTDIKHHTISVVDTIDFPPFLAHACSADNSLFIVGEGERV